MTWWHQIAKHQDSMDLTQDLVVDWSTNDWQMQNIEGKMHTPWDTKHSGPLCQSLAGQRNSDGSNVPKSCPAGRSEDAALPPDLIQLEQAHGHQSYDSFGAAKQLLVASTCASTTGTKYLQIQSVQGCSGLSSEAPYNYRCRWLSWYMSKVMAANSAAARWREVGFPWSVHRWRRRMSVQQWNMSCPCFAA